MEEELFVDFFKYFSNTLKECAKGEKCIDIVTECSKKESLNIRVLSLHFVSVGFKLLPVNCTHFDNRIGSHLLFILLCSIHTILFQKLSKGLLKIRKRLKRPYFFSGVLSRLDGFVDGGVGGRERFSARSRVAFKSEQSGLSQLTIVCVTRVSG